MRSVMLILVLFLGGCFATQTSHNPLAKKGADVAPVVSELPAAKAEPKPIRRPAPAPGSDRLELLKEMFTMHIQLKKEVLRMAADLTSVELVALNKFLSKYGVRIHNKNHVHKPKHNSRAF